MTEVYQSHFEEQCGTVIDWKQRNLFKAKNCRNWWKLMKSLLGKGSVEITEDLYLGKLKGRWDHKTWKRIPREDSFLIANSIWFWIYWICDIVWTPMILVSPVWKKKKKKGLKVNKSEATFRSDAWTHNLKLWEHFTHPESSKRK